MQVIKTSDSLLKEKHLDTLTSISNLAFTLKSQTRYEEDVFTKNMLPATNTDPYLKASRRKDIT